jgi:hypothetical protein
VENVHDTVMPGSDLGVEAAAAGVDVVECTGDDSEPLTGTKQTHHAPQQETAAAHAGRDRSDVEWKARANMQC